VCVCVCVRVCLRVCVRVRVCVCVCERGAKGAVHICILTYIHIFEFMQINTYMLCKAHFAPGANADSPSQTRAAIEANEALPLHHTERAPRKNVAGAPSSTPGCVREVRVFAVCGE